MARKARRSSSMRFKDFPGNFLYAAGGNPSIAAGLFTREGDRVAYWPAGYEPTQYRFEIVYRLVIAREDDKPVSRAAILKAFRGGESE